MFRTEHTALELLRCPNLSRFSGVCVTETGTRVRKWGQERGLRTACLGSRTQARADFLRSLQLKTD